MESPALVSLQTTVDLAALPRVTNAQVVKYALPAHAKCGGAGLLNRHLPIEKQRLCECAMKRFMARHKSEVMSVGGGEMAWLRSEHATTTEIR